MPFKLGSNRVPYDKDGRRLCGTPGCTFFDEHDGPCSNAVPLEKRPRYQPPPPKPKAAPSEPKKKRQRQFNPEDASSAADVPPEVDLRPAVQTVRKDGLHDFYHVHRWGQPLPPGPVAAVNGNASDDDSGGHLQEASEPNREPETEPFSNRNRRNQPQKPNRTNRNRKPAFGIKSSRGAPPPRTPPGQLAR